MNKQFLSLLLLTSFVGTMSANGLFSFAPRTVHSIFANGYVRTFGSAMASKVTGLLGKAGSKIAGLSLTAQEAILTVPLVGAPIGMVAGVTAVNDHFVAKAAAEVARLAANAEVARLAANAEVARVTAAELARLNARPFYTKAGQAISGYASNGLKAVTGYAVVAKTSVSNGVQAVVASAKLHPKSAIAAGVVGTAAVSYLAYKLYSRFSSRSISLTEQEKANLTVALVRADTLGKQVFHNPSVTTPVRLEEVFTTESTGLPKKAVDALNKHVALSRKLSDIASIQSIRALSPNDLAIQQELKKLDAQLLGMFPITAAA